MFNVLGTCKPCYTLTQPYRWHLRRSLAVLLLGSDVRRTTRKSLLLRAPRYRTVRVAVFARCDGGSGGRPRCPLPAALSPFPRLSSGLVDHGAFQMGIAADH